MMPMGVIFRSAFTAARVHNRRTASYLLGIPLLPDFLEEALAAFGRSCEEFEEDHL